MLKLIEMDANVTIGEQLNEGGGPVVLIAQFKVAIEDAKRKHYLEGTVAAPHLFRKVPHFNL